MVTTISFPIHIFPLKAAFVFISLYEILRILDPECVLTKGICKRILCDIFLSFLSLSTATQFFGGKKWELSMRKLKE